MVFRLTICGQEKRRYMAEIQQEGMEQIQVRFDKWSIENVKHLRNSQINLGYGSHPRRNGLVAG